ncbi:MAG TPA: response regulator [Burkholderiales bacterium]|nr:response regulator [Burkholderiales bacterium]
MSARRILVVDDDGEMRDAMAHILRAAGYEVELAHDGNAAIEAQLARPADVLITDVFMPARDGLETIQYFRSEYPDIRIIAMTGGSPMGRIDEYLGVAKVAGADATLRKPFAAQTLLESLSAL